MPCRWERREAQRLPADSPGFGVGARGKLVASDDLLSGEDGDDVLLGGTQNDNLLGGNGNDNLQGQDGNDTLTGGAGNDTLDGGAGDDSLDGGTGNDTYLFGRGSGKDTVSAYDTTAGKLDVVQLGSDVLTSDVTLSRESDTLVLTINGTGDILKVSSYFNSDAAGPYQVEQIKFADGTIWDVAAVKARALLGTAGSDALTGYASADSMSGLAGDDTLYGRAGNDTLDGGVGADLLSGDDGDDVLLGGTQNDNLLGGNGNDNLQGQDGNDTLTGGAGNDTLDGGAGNDTLDGGVGNDTYIVGRGQGAELVQDSDATSGNTDVVQFAAGVTADQIWFRKVGNDLEVSIIGSNDKLTVQSWYSGSQYHVEQFKTSDGKTLLDSKVQELVSAMASFSPPTTGQSTLPSNYQTTLMPIIAADWGP